MNGFSGPKRFRDFRETGRRIKINILLIKENSVSNIDDYISFSNCRTTRNSQNFYKLFKPCCRTDIFKNSFFNRRIDQWEDLPASVANLESSNSFEKALKKILLTN